MAMLRDAYAYGTEELREILSRFDIGVKLIDVKGFTMLTPDSFLWRLRMGDDETYYLYAEDYLADLSHVRKEIEAATGSQDGIFIPLKDHKPQAQRGKAVQALAREITLAEDRRGFVTESGIDTVALYRPVEQEEV